jgi:transmembrane 9 superfamily protein 3
LCRYAKEDGDLESLERDLNEETGWKLVHGDVFRAPQHRMLLAACVGTGGQLCMLGLFVILLTIMGTFYEVRWLCDCADVVTVAMACCRASVC